jgi:hypothetical protein
LQGRYPGVNTVSECEMRRGTSLDPVDAALLTNL